MTKNNKIAIKILLVFIGFLMLLRILSILDLKYNISISDKFDIVDNILYYAFAISFYLAVLALLYLLYSMIRKLLGH